MNVDVILAAAGTSTPDLAARDLLTKFVNHLPDFGMAVVIMLLGWWVAGRVHKVLRHVFVARHVDTTLAAFLAQLGYWLLMVIVVITALGQAGLPTTSIITVLGASTLAIGLALQSSLSNFAAGMMIILFRHFRVGDYIEAGGVAGIVEEISIFDTILTTIDNRKIIVPNSAILASPILNASAKPTRRLDLIYNISYDSDITLAKQIIMSTATGDPATLPEPAPVVGVTNLGESSVDLTLRMWVNVKNFLDLRSRMLETVKLRFDAAGIVIPYPQRDVHMHAQKSP